MVDKVCATNFHKQFKACVWPGHIEQICSHHEEIISVVESNENGNSNYVSANSQLAIHNDLFQLIVNNFQSPPMLAPSEQEGDC